MLANSLAIIGLSCGVDQKRHGGGTFTDRPDGSWDQIAENMMMNFSESAHPIFRASNALERGELRSKEHDTKSIHFNGGYENIEFASPHGDFRESVECLRSRSRFMQHIIRRS